jgi:hypothetical protein
MRSIRPFPLKFLYFDALVIFCEEYNYLSKYCISCDEVLLLFSHVSFSVSTENWGASNPEKGSNGRQRQQIGGTAGFD